MSIAQTLAAIKAMPNVSAEWLPSTREYRVIPLWLPAKVTEENAYYTDDADDAVGTAALMNLAQRIGTIQ